MPRPDDIVIGKIVAPIGVRGEVKVLVLTDFPERFDPGKSVTVKSAGAKTQHRIVRARPHKAGIVVKLERIDSRDEAEKLRDSEIVIGPDDLGELPEDRFYLFDLIGLKVITDDGREQGTVTEVLQGGANDVYVTSTGLCIPALKNVVARIDVLAGLMIIRPVPGLLPED
jgi:16S rRNA processing protein RimM